MKTKSKSGVRLQFKVVGDRDSLNRFWSGMHYFQDNTNEFDRQPIVQCSSVDPLSVNVFNITLNPKIPGGAAICRALAVTAGVGLLPDGPAKQK